MTATTAPSGYPGPTGSIEDPTASNPANTQTRSNYYGGTQFVIPRAVYLLDYVYGGPAFDTNNTQIIGGPAEIHAESGDTQIYGGPNLDYLFGGSGNDQIVGGYGGKWIAGGDGLVGSPIGTVNGAGDLISQNSHTDSNGHLVGVNSTGILGSDGRLLLSRNGIPEPLYGITTTYADGTTANELISTPGKMQQAVINQTGQLKFTADLTPFNADPNGVLTDWTPNTLNSIDYAYPTQQNDIIYSGLGNTSVHGGPGDSAISGAQALPKFWADPVLNPNLPVSYNAEPQPIDPATGNPVVPPSNSNIATAGILQFNAGGSATSNLFSDYNEFAPLQLIGSPVGSAVTATNPLTLDGFFLNFNQNEGMLVIGGGLGGSVNTSNPTALPSVVYDAGNKALFGDLGHNWIDGANSMADIYGGFGDDLLNAQRNLTIDNGLNDIPDNSVLPPIGNSTGPTFHAIVFGGAGRSTLIAGGVYDRLIDWKGEFNQYVVPFAPYGAPTISRDMSPQLFTYLYQLSASDGADNTAVGPIGSDGISSDPTRNGEPYGELGLVTHVDPFWTEQGGSPNQAVADGHIPGGPRDIIGSAAFARGTLDTSGMEIVSGTMTMSNGTLNTAPATVGTNSFATLDPNTQLPNYFEITTMAASGKPTGGYQSNAYIIFDYQGPNNFKFAGIDESIDKIEIGHFDGTNWIIDAQTPAHIHWGTMYNVFLALNGNYAYLIVNNQVALGYAFPWTVVDGVNNGLGYGIVGLGSNNSTSSFGDLVIQQPVPPTSFTYTETFSGGTAQYFDQPSSGSWTIAPGSDTGTASTDAGAPSGGAAVQLIDLGLAAGMPAGSFRLQSDSTLDLEATLQTGGEAGLVYAYDNSGYFKFAALLYGKQEVVLGHYTPNSGFAIDAAAPYAQKAGKSYSLDVSLVGNAVTLKVNGNPELSWDYNSVVTGGQFGLVVLSGSATFSQASVFTDDTGLPTETIQHMNAAAAPTGPAQGVTDLTSAELQSILNAAIDRLSAALVLGSGSIAELDAATIQIAALPGLDLGITVGDTITISPDAAGWGWFVDQTPYADSEFPVATPNGLKATPGSPAYGEMDLLTVVMHELAHVLGYADTTSGLMSETLAAGTRLAPPAAESGGSLALGGVAGGDGSYIPPSALGPAKTNSTTATKFFHEKSGRLIDLGDDVRWSWLLDGVAAAANEPASGSGDWIIRGIEKQADQAGNDGEGRLGAVVPLVAARQQGQDGAGSGTADGLSIDWNATFGGLKSQLAAPLDLSTAAE